MTYGIAASRRTCSTAGSARRFPAIRRLRSRAGASSSITSRSRSRGRRASYCSAAAPTRSRTRIAAISSTGCARRSICPARRSASRCGRRQIPTRGASDLHMSETHPQGPRRAALAFIFVTVVLDMLALGMIVPVLPKLVEDFVGGNTARAAEIYGLFGTVWALMQFVFSPVLGALSDRYGRRPVILLSNLGLGLDYLVMALAPSLAWLFVGRVISGITAASFSTAYAYITDVTEPAKRAASFGMMSAAFGLGFVLGPAIGGVLGHIDPRLPFWVAAGFSLLNYLYGLLVLPESLPQERRERFSWRRANPVGSITLLRSHRELLGLAFVNFIGSIAHEALPTTFVLYAMYRYGWNERTVGLAIAAVGVCSAIVGAGLVQPAVARFGERRVMLLGHVFGIAGFTVYGLAST